MKASKRLEYHCKRGIRSILARLLRTEQIQPRDVDLASISRILVIRQDSRLGNLVLMTPLLSALKAAFPEAEVDALISEGFEEILAGNPNVDRLFLFRKRTFRLFPWRYIGLTRELRRKRYDLAIDVSDGRHFSLNGALLLRFSGARHRLGYDREDASVFMNVLVPPPPADMPMADAIRDILKPIVPGIREYPTVFYLSDDDRVFAGEWLQVHDISEYDSFFVFHPGGKGKKRWGAGNFAELIDRIAGVTGARIVVAGAGAERETIGIMMKRTRIRFDVLENVTVGQMAAIIDRCDLFVSGDTGPMHVAVALGRPVVAIFQTSNHRVYGPRAKNSRIVTGEDSEVTVDAVVNAIWDLLSIGADSGA
ncbi:MAG: glycosyltransferase family 9 protein [Candidatus Latescibacterota bacterium]